MTQRLIAVGDSADIEIVFATRKYTGEQVKRTTVVTSDITKGNTSLILHATVAGQNDTIGGILLVDPPFVDIAQDERDREFDVMVTNLAEVPLTPTLVSAPYEVFEIDYVNRAIPPGESARMKVRVTDGTEVNTAKKSFTFEFDDARRTRFSLPVELRATPRQAIEPTESTGGSGGS